MEIIFSSDKWIGSSLPEIYSYLKDGDGKKYLDTINIQLAGIEERKNITYFIIIIIHIKLINFFNPSLVSW